MMIARNEPNAVGVPGLGMIPDWYFTNQKPNDRYNDHVKFPAGMYQTTVQPVGPYFTSGMDLKGLGAWEMPTWFKVFYQVASVAGAGAMGYHGYKRNDSVGWAIWWSLWGGLFPFFTPVIAYAQGFGKLKKGK